MLLLNQNSTCAALWAACGGVKPKEGAPSPQFILKEVKINVASVFDLDRVGFRSVAAILPCTIGVSVGTPFMAPNLPQFIESKSLLMYMDTGVVDVPYL